MQPIITSIFDSDFYKFSMQYAILKRWGRDENPVVYQFNNRRKEDKFTPEMVNKIRKHIDSMADIIVYKDEVLLFGERFPFFDKAYLGYLSSFRFEPSQVKVWLDGEDNLQLTITGPWHETILWEVPLMAIISEVYFEDKPLDYELLNLYYEHLKQKYTNLKNAGCQFSDFGTRRRRSKAIQNMVVRSLDAMENKDNENIFIGTSNVHLGLNLGCPIIGSIAHEFFMGVSGINGTVKEANANALEIWSNVYRGQLGIALTDTFGTKAFFKDFDGYYARLYDGVRHDSGDAFDFTDKVIAHYESLGIDPISKKIVYSDGLNVAECIKIKKHINGRIKCFFGIGTNLTNDVPGSKALNIVIKLRKVRNQEVVKISDNPGKATGDAVALAEAFKILGL